MRPSILARRRFSKVDQITFAELSGDFNPIHLDEIATRRMLFGEPIVHGVHGVLWALESFLASAGGTPNGRVSCIRVDFSNPVFFDETVNVRLAAGHMASATLHVGGAKLRCATIDLQFNTSDAKNSHDADLQVDMQPRFARVPRKCQPANLNTMRGRLAIVVDPRVVAHAFPACVESLGVRKVGVLLAISRLVGMRCPGQQSLFSSFILKFGENAPQRTLHFSVNRFDSRLSRVNMGVSCGDAEGEVIAFVRPEPVANLGIDTVKPKVRPDEFAGQCGVIVGGSRGLGEATAKLLAHGGGHPIITYVVGEQEARRVVREIRQRSGRCDMVKLDAASPNAGVASIANAGWQPTHVYYFATPKIFLRRTASFEPRILERFIRFYCDYFYLTYAALVKISKGPLSVFYPSSVAVDNAPTGFLEYALAKSAGENLCHQMGLRERQDSFLVHRLPRVMTDQTASLRPAPAECPLTVMLPILRSMGKRRFNSEVQRLRKP
jgi:hypothetical protein